MALGWLGAWQKPVLVLLLLLIPRGPPCGMWACVTLSSHLSLLCLPL